MIGKVEFLNLGGGIMQTVQDYLSFLHTKGFKLSEDAQGFIMFGQGYTGSSDGIVNAAIEATIKHQLQFDGSYFIALLERLKEEEITDKKSAMAFLRKLQS